MTFLQTLNKVRMMNAEVLLAFVAGGIGAIIGIAYTEHYYTVDRAQTEFETNKDNYIYNWDGWRKDGTLNCHGDRNVRSCTLLEETIEPATGITSNRLRIIVCSPRECQWAL